MNMCSVGMDALIIMIMIAGQILMHINFYHILFLFLEKNSLD
jgi:hypothetical protein